MSRSESPEALDEALDEALSRGVEIGRRLPVYFALAMAGLMALSFVGGVLVFLYLGLFAEPSFYVHHLGPQPATVLVDGVLLAELPGTGVTEIKVPRGEHELEILVGEERQRWHLERVNGLDDQLLPTDPDTCFAVVDVSWALYGQRARHPDAGLCDADFSQARITCTYEGFPMEVGGPRFTLDALPEQRSLSTLVTLTLPVPCAELDLIDASALLRAAVGC
ncbi:MAG: hypothetical protein H6741_00600 [Alphaproteobacteria bacterium]|nr:hypothetical protein [Alphaproteobacteria bacterium]MCB9791204.1 hypothetical protein [Alphaproteobacteria bacterium]